MIVGNKVDILDVNPQNRKVNTNSAMKYAVD